MTIYLINQVITQDRRKLGKEGRIDVRPFQITDFLRDDRTKEDDLGRSPNAEI